MSTDGLTAVEVARRVASREVSAEEVARACLDRIAERDRGVDAFLAVAADRALESARRVDRDLAGGRPAPPLAGVPVAVKDVLDIEGMPTTCGSRILEGYRPPFTATAIARLEQAGAVVVGKTNMDEFAMGSSTENSAFKPTRNPWDRERVPGGSSGGSAAAVAAGMVPVALGTDTGGSIRQPAALCGVLGLKPTYGRVSRYGLIAFGSSLDQIGPFAASTRDMAALFGVIAGRDPRDSTSAVNPVPDYTAGLTGDLGGLRVGVPRGLLDEGVEPGVKEAFDAALREMAGAGAILSDITLPHASLAIPVYYLVANAEASSNLARYDGVRYGTRAEAATLTEMYYRTRARFGAEVKRRIMIGTFVLSAGYYDAYYVKAQQVRALIRKDYDEAFAKVDVVALPTSPTVAFRLGARTADPIQMYLADVFTAAANLAGLPAISIPCGLTKERLPVGLQLTARPFDEAALLRAADVLERRIVMPRPDAGSL